jgi:DNA polymerase III epsilon subunit-like protein
MLIVDVEASGVDYEKCSIVSVGALDLAHPENQLYEECRVWDGAHIESGALAVNGMSEEEITDPQKQSEADLVHKFITFARSVEEQTFAGQNVSFDRDFLRAAAMRAGHTDWPFAHRTIDVHTLCFMHMTKRGLTPPTDPEKKHSKLNLDAVLLYCGIPEEPKPHNALTGAKSHAEVISRLLYDKKLLAEFDRFAMPWLSA